MTSTTNKPFHTYENVGYDDKVNNLFKTNPTQTAATTTTTNIAVNKTTTVESPFPDPINDSSNATRILSAATDSTGTTRMLTARATVPVQNLVTKLISLPSHSPMDSIREWSVSTFKCTKQLINEKRGMSSITTDVQLQADIEQLRETKNKLVQMLRAVCQMNNHYTHLVKTQRQLQGLMYEMSVKCFTTTSSISSNGNSVIQNSKQVVANFSSLSSNLSTKTSGGSSSSSNNNNSNSSSSATTDLSNQSNSSDNLNNFQPILNHIKSSHVNLIEDFKKNGLVLNATIKNGEKLVAVLSFFCSNLSTLINKTIDDTLISVKQFETARLEYDAERNSMNFASCPSAQTSITYSSDKLELSRLRYEQLKEDVQIKMKFLEENSIKVMHKQLLMFNSAFASYSSGNTAALDATLEEFSIKH